MASARWHTLGHRIVYLGATPAGCLLEALVHLELPPDLLPDSYQLLRIGIPDSISQERIESLPDGWMDHLPASRSVGDRWLHEERSALLEVPSVIVPETWNWVLNPNHPQAREAEIEWSGRFPFDSRLLRFGK